MFVGYSPVRCGAGMYLCDDGRQCVVRTSLCDGLTDCRDRSDERHCGKYIKKIFEVYFTWMTPKAARHAISLY